MGIYDEVDTIVRQAEARHDETELRHYFDEQDRILALLAPVELAVEERDTIKTAYDLAADWHAAVPTASTCARSIWANCRRRSSPIGPHRCSTETCR